QGDLHHGETGIRTSRRTAPAMAVQCGLYVANELTNDGAANARRAPREVKSGVAPIVRDATVRRRLNLGLPCGDARLEAFHLGSARGCQVVGFAGIGGEIVHQHLGRTTLVVFDELEIPLTNRLPDDRPAAIAEEQGACFVRPTVGKLADDIATDRKSVV